jgi:hypothetical protein
MVNIFDADEAYEGEPTEIVVGDFIQWKRSDLVTDYPLATHSMEYVARIRGGGAFEIKLAATEITSPTESYLFTVDSATSATFTAGDYYWQLEVTETASGNRAVVDTGRFRAIEDLDVDGADPRTHAEIMLTKIESILEGKADSDVSNYAIGGRSLTKMSWEELMQARDRYKAEVTRDRAKQTNGNGKQTVRVQFNGVS